MKVYKVSPGKKNVVAAIFTAVLFIGNALPIFAHGGEDHGDQKPAIAAAGEKGITRTARLGAYEVTFKQPNFEPDTAASAKLFVTKFQTNEPLENAAAMVEIESANGSVIETVIEKTGNAGSYSVKIPALPQGVYTVRAKLTYHGETDTATFSGVEVAPTPVALTENGMSLARTILIAVIFAFVLALFGGLIYYVWRFADGNESVVEKETVAV